MGLFRAATLGAALLAAAIPAHAQVGESIVAVVNDDMITSYELRQRAQMLLAFAETERSPEMLALAQEQALRGLIDEKLQVQEARSLERRANAQGQIIPDEAAIDNALQSLAAQSGTDLATNMRQLEGAGVDPSTLRDQLRAEISWDRLIQSRYQDGVRINSELVDEALREMVQALQEPQYRVAEIFLEINSAADEAGVREQMANIVQQLQASGRFVELARQYSQAPSAQRGGDRGFQPLSGFPPEVAAVLPSIPVESVANPIRTAGGLYLVALIDRRDAASAEQLTLKAIVLPLDAAATDGARAQARVALGEAAQGRQGCDAADAIAAAVDGAFVSDLGTLAGSSLQPAVREALAGLAPGQISAAISSPLGAQIFLLCDRSIGGPGLPSREEIAAQMEDQRLSMLSRRYLRDLHREALIDIRGFEGR